MITHWWLGDATETTAIVCCRCDSDGLVTGSGSAGAASETAATTTKDGIVALTFTGLSADTSYSFTAAQGNSINGTLKTMPSGGTFNVSWMSCNRYEDSSGARVDFRSGDDLSDIWDCKAIFWEGDLFYSDNDASPLQRYGETPVRSSSEPTGAAGTANSHKFFRRELNNPHIYKMTHRIPWYMGSDDHEFAGNDFDHTVSNANVYATWCSTTGEVSDMYDAYFAGITSYSAGNPVNTDSGIDAGALYYRKTIANCEFFVLDSVSYRDPVADTDDASKTMLGANQKAWLMAKVVASTATFKIIMTPKKLLKHTIDNGDTWGVYSTERNEILQETQTNATGVVWLSGDKHKPNVAYIQAGSPAYKALDVCACPIASKTNNLSFPYGSCIWVHGTGTGTAADRCYGILKITPEYVEPKIVSVAGKVWWKGRVYAGSNELTIPPISAAI